MIQHQENVMINPETVPHPFIVTTIPDGREYDWPHPENCPSGDACDILRRVRRNRSEYLADLVEGRPDGTYRLGLFGFHGLVLIDDERNILPDVAQ